MIALTHTLFVPHHKKNKQREHAHAQAHAHETNHEDKTTTFTTCNMVISHMIEELQLKLNASLEREAALNTELQQALILNNKLATQKATIHKSLVEQVNRLAAELSSKKEQAEDAQQECRRLTLKTVQQEDEINELTTEATKVKQHMNERIDSLQQELESAYSENVAIKTEHEAITASQQATIDELSSQLTTVTTKYNALVTSSSSSPSPTENTNVAPRFNRARRFEGGV